jgi:hypothetical protein
MYNWNTDTTKFKTVTDKKVWELIQLIEYGTQGQKIKRKDLIKYGPRIKNHVEPAVKRLLEYVLWGKLSSLPNNNFFWDVSSPLQKLPITSI